MRFEIEDVSIIYPNEEDIVDRTLVIEDDISCLSLNFVDDTDERVGAMFLNKDQVILLRDTLGNGMLSSTIQQGMPLKMNSVIFFGNKTVMSDNDWYDCALRSLGIEALIKLFDSGISSAAKSTIKKKALRKMVVKVASRTLGVIGAAIAVYEFGDCMDWY